MRRASSARIKRTPNRYLSYTPPLPIGDATTSRDADEVNMRMLFTSAMVVILTVSAGAQAPRVSVGKRLYVDSATQFGVALSAAIIKKRCRWS